MRIPLCASVLFLYFFLIKTSICFLGHGNCDTSLSNTDGDCDALEKAKTDSDLVSTDNAFKNNVGISETRVTMSRYHLGTENSRIYKERSSKRSAEGAAREFGNRVTMRSYRLNRQLNERRNVDRQTMDELRSVRIRQIERTMDSQRQQADRRSERNHIIRDGIQRISNDGNKRFIRNERISQQLSPTPFARYIRNELSRNDRNEERSRFENRERMVARSLRNVVDRTENRRISSEPMLTLRSAPIIHSFDVNGNWESERMVAINGAMDSRLQTRQADSRREYSRKLPLQERRSIDERTSRSERTMYNRGQNGRGVSRSFSEARNERSTERNVDIAENLAASSSRREHNTRVSRNERRNENIRRIALAQRLNVHTNRRMDRLPIRADRMSKTERSYGRYIEERNVVQYRTDRSVENRRESMLNDIRNTLAFDEGAVDKHSRMSSDRGRGVLHLNVARNTPVNRNSNGHFERRLNDQHNSYERRSRELNDVRRLEGTRRTSAESRYESERSVEERASTDEPQSRYERTKRRIDASRRTRSRDMPTSSTERRVHEQTYTSLAREERHLKRVEISRQRDNRINGRQMDDAVRARSNTRERITDTETSLDRRFDSTRTYMERRSQRESERHAEERNSNRLSSIERASRNDRSVRRVVDEGRRSADDSERHIAARQQTRLASTDKRQVALAERREVTRITGNRSGLENAGRTAEPVEPLAKRTRETMDASTARLDVVRELNRQLARESRRTVPTRRQATRNLLDHPGEEYEAHEEKIAAHDWCNRRMLQLVLLSLISMHMIYKALDTKAQLRMKHNFFFAAAALKEKVL